MSSIINWNTTELQIEIVVPGIIWVIEFKYLIDETIIRFPNLQRVFESDFRYFWSNLDLYMQGLFLIAFSYAVSLVFGYLSRWLFDKLSEYGFRAKVFEKNAHSRREYAVAYCTQYDPFFSHDLENEKKKRKILIAEWNAIYRSAIRLSNNNQEVWRRRSQGRIIRNLLIPIVFSPFIIFGIYWQPLILALLLAFLSVYIYAYAEYFNFAEAWDIIKSSFEKPRGFFFE